MSFMQNRKTWTTHRHGGVGLFSESNELLLHLTHVLVGGGAADGMGGEL